VNVVVFILSECGAGVGDACDLAEALIVKEKESPVSEDGPADAASILVPQWESDSKINFKYAAYFVDPQKHAVKSPSSPCIPPAFSPSKHHHQNTNSPATPQKRANQNPPGQTPP
jgi:hypothetical protein